MAVMVVAVKPQYGFQIAAGQARPDGAGRFHLAVFVAW
jgi:hypothetical protein